MLEKETLLEFEYHNDSLWNGDAIFEAVDKVKPISIGEVFGYCEDELGENEICEVIGESRDEWVYERFANSWMAGDGQLYKAVSVTDYEIDRIGVTTIEIQDIGKHAGKLIASIDDQNVIANVINVLTGSDVLQTPSSIRTDNSKLIRLLSRNHPGLVYESILAFDTQGNRYLTALNAGGGVFEIGELLDRFIG